MKSLRRIIEKIAGKSCSGQTSSEDKISRRDFGKILGVGSAVGAGALMFSDDVRAATTIGTDSISTGGGDLDLGSGNITSVGNVDGVDISSHASNNSAHHTRPSPGQNMTEDGSGNFDVTPSTIDPTNLDGSGGTSGQVLKTDGSNASWGSSSVSIDNQTIKKNPQDELSVARPAFEVVGDFETGKGAWSGGTRRSQSGISNNMFEVDGSNLNGNYGMTIQGGGNVQADFDLTDRTKIIVDYEIGDVYGNGGEHFGVRVGGDLLFTKTSGLSPVEGTATVDITGYSGTTTVKMESNQDPDKGTNQIVFDYVRLKVGPGQIVRPEAGGST